MSIPTGIWLLMLAAVVIIYSIYFFGETGVPHRTIRDRLRTILLPNSDFQASSLADAAARLTELSQAHDALGDGVLFKIIAEPCCDGLDASIFLRFERTPLWEALEQVALLYGVTYRIDGAAYTVTFQADHPSPALLQRHYRLPPEQFPTPWACRDYLAYFQGYGLQFPTVDSLSSHIEYDQKSHVLTVHSVENTLNLMEKIFNLDPDKCPEN